MSDLVERLRRADGAYYTAEALQKLLREAADRIEWLEGRAGAISAGLNEIGNTVHEASETNRRLGRILNGG